MFRTQTTILFFSLAWNVAFADVNEVSPVVAPRLTIEPSGPVLTLVLNPTDSSLRYQFQESHDLHANHWKNIGEAMQGDEKALELTIKMNSSMPRAFYRVAIEENPLASEFVEVDGYKIARYELTWGKWKEIRAEAARMGYDIANAGAGSGDNHPVRHINWHDAVKWCNLRSELEGLKPVYHYDGEVFRAYPIPAMFPEMDVSANGYRLPTVAEWSYAAGGGAAGSGYVFSGGNDLNEVGWFEGNSGGAVLEIRDGRGTWPVGLKAANELGIYDMSGNVWEFCSDVIVTPFADPLYVRQMMGGSWDTAEGLCVLRTSRAICGAVTRFSNVGIRLVRNSKNQGD